MTNYYFVGTLLPDLYIDQPPEIGFEELMNLLHDNLSSNDYAQAMTVLNYYDLFNLLSYIKDEPLDKYGNMDEKEIEEALATRSILPPYVFNYLDKYQDKDDQLIHFPELLSKFFNEEIKKVSGSFKEFLILERNVRLISTAYRAKKMGKDIFLEMQYESPEDEIVSQIIARKDSPQFEFPEKYEDLKPVFDQNYANPIAFQKALLEYRFNKIDTMIGLDFFSLNRLLAYMIKLIMVERWQRLDREQGLKIIDNMLKEPS